MSVEAMQAIAAQTGATMTTSKNTIVLTVRPDQVSDVCGKVAAIPGFYHLVTITGMDLGDQIALLYHFWQGTTFAVVQTLVPKTDLRIASVTTVLPAALLYEAEVKDMLGIVFDGNSLMKTKLLLPDEYPKDAPPPLRKEADLAKIRRMMGLE